MRRRAGQGPTRCGGVRPERTQPMPSSRRFTQPEPTNSVESAVHTEKPNDPELVCGKCGREYGHKGYYKRHVEECNGF